MPNANMPSETTILDENLYPVFYTAPIGTKIGIMLQQCFNPWGFMDWSTGGFTLTPKQIIQPLFQYTNPVISGNVQRFGYVIGAKAFTDGYYGIWYTWDDILITGSSPEQFYIYKGRVNTFPRFDFLQH